MAFNFTDEELVERLKLLRKHGGSKTEAAKAMGVNRSTFKDSIAVAEARGLTADSTVQSAEGKLKHRVKMLEADLKRAQNAADSAEAIRKEIFNLAGRSPEPPAWLSGASHKVGSRGVPTMIWSDWHYGEVVRPEEVGGVNEFNTDIAEARIKRLVDTTVDLSYNHMGRAKKEYPGAVVMLGGDMMTGDIHDEITQTNDRTPQQQINGLTDALASAIEKMASAFGRLYVPCVVGNHGRDSKKPRTKGRVYCLDAETPVLTRDLRWVSAGSLKLGDGLYAFDEHQTGPRGRSYRPGLVTHAEVKTARTIKITLESGRVFHATPEHKFLAQRQTSDKVRWMSAEQLLAQHQGTRKNKGTWRLPKFLDTWQPDTSREAGYLAGVFDGEGTLAKNHTTRYARAQISVTQYPNACLAETKRCLSALGFAFNESIIQNKYGKPCHYLTLQGGLNEVLRFLGQVRPHRLLAKWLEGDASDRYMNGLLSDRIVSAEDGGERQIAMVSSSTGTYLSAGYASHNTSHEWVIYTNLERFFRKSKHVSIHVPPESDAHFKVYNHKYLLTHGDSLGVKGGDGIIGAIGPIMRGTIKTGRSEAHIGRDFDTIVMGHWHQTLWLPGCIVNSSLKGYDEFARLVLRAPYSRPAQSLWFTHPEHGLTAKWEVFLEGQRQAQDENEWVTWQERKSA